MSTSNTTNNDKLAQLDPAEELYFPAPYTESVMTPLKLTNITGQSVVFKVKTTMPRMYTVRPTHGVIAPHGEFIISIILHSTSVESLSGKSRHKFLIQLAPGPKSSAGGSNVNLPADFKPVEYWKQVSAGDIIERRLRCAFDLPSQTPTNRLDSISRRTSRTTVQSARGDGGAAGGNDSVSTMATVSDQQQQQRCCPLFARCGGGKLPLLIAILAIVIGYLWFFYNNELNDVGKALVKKN